MAFMRLKRLSKEKRGAATVEMVVVILMLLSVTFGAIEYGWVFYRMQQVSNVARESARTAALANNTATDAQARFAELVTDWGLTGAILQINPASPEGALQGDPITVTVTVPYAGMELVGLVPTPNNLTSSATMARE